MTDYSDIWTRETSFKLLLSSILLKYGDYLKWTHCNETILHDGCADGTLTKDILLPYVNGHIEEVWAFDKWKYIIDAAEQTNPSDKIKYQLYNVMTRNVREMENKFDRIFSLFTAEVIVPNRVLLRKYHKMLKRSGQVFIVLALNTAVVNSIGIQAQQKKWSRYLKVDKILENYTCNPLDYFQNLLGETGFKTEYCDLVETSVVIENFSDMLKLAWPMYGSFWKCLPNNLKEEFLKENTQICEEMMTYLCEPNTYRMPVDTLICIASKV
ncbi:hypothetical protein QE152_g22746 [Popillia japonica]|uniref:Methyltransferase type 11 domain-containing protein n=1 Tax=Popillia japonica TaxID=7064 RepID=A0AAW1KHQ7_POPJA